MNPVLIVAAHRTPDASRINRAALAALSQQEGVTIHELIREYPDFNIDVTREQQLLNSHDTIVLLFPFYWYSTPAIMKEWLDVVLTAGFAYAGGTALHGKKLLVATSTGGSAQAYTPEGYNNYSIDALLLPLQNTANRTGMIWQPPQLIQGANDITEQQITDGVTQLVQRIDSFIPVVS
ncbi:NAD(P)H-dependent oxidoreductase [Erwiniaceae bacterium BAC15a-03b]|uniref:NAD(P)H-dependent oxidoreductase n=1 Tax=Winslowiella arboricola TaxID=2978220 RepID=A0A9J6PM10_9GAMM|nr:NAD(P)H-dependent oxidoreductase [Winslowiella arboricola]MCU5773380.1 NAD(P)H-dependent oxidoreductase [Winslowiella arboricola]MCU5776704.1 NAD(P)H-dependent oxidoreductase [Winslowiella arboricola]